MSVALALTGALVPPVRAMARKLGILDHPGDRKLHSEPMPRLGGLAVLPALLLVVVGGLSLVPVLRGIPWVADRYANALAMLAQAHTVQVKLFAVFAGSAIVFGVGLADDILGNRFPLWMKVVGQTAAATVVVAADVRTSFLPQEWMNTTVTLLWLVGMTNAFNLLDNMDGLSAGVAAVASSILLLNAWTLREFFICLILSAFIGTLLGFLIFNFHPASVFLGDCGSLSVGFMMGSLTLLERYASHASSSLFPVLMPVLVLAVPLMDTATVVVIRLREGRPVYVGDTRHLSHRLVSLGFSQRAAVLFLYLATFCLGLGAVSLTDAGPFQAFLVLLQAAGFVALLLILLFFDRHRAPRSQTP